MAKPTKAPAAAAPSIEAYPPLVAARQRLAALEARDQGRRLQADAAELGCLEPTVAIPTLPLSELLGTR